MKPSGKKIKNWAYEGLLVDFYDVPTQFGMYVVFCTRIRLKSHLANTRSF